MMRKMSSSLSIKYGLKKVRKRTRVGSNRKDSNPVDFNINYVNTKFN